MSLILRKAEKEDLPILIHLIDQLGYQIDFESLSRSLDLYGDSVLVAVSEDRVVACMAYHILPVFHSKDCFLRIVSLVVDQDCRGKGIGKLMVQEAERIAKLKGCTAIELSSGAHRAKSGAHAFYARGGFNNDSLYFRKRLAR